MTSCDEDSCDKLAPFLRWAGSKRQLVSRLRAYYPEDAPRYIEPFAGSSCLFFALRPNRAVLGDANRELISTYREVKYRPDAVAAGLQGLRRSKRRYLDLREDDPRSLTPSNRAVRFIYLNRYCFNGLYRTNTKGQFNVPFGGKGTGRLPSRESLRACSRVLKVARLVGGDFQQTIKHAEEGDFVYMDPPFLTETRRVFREYTKATFSRNDLTRLRKCMEELHRGGVRFLVSYAECDEAHYLGRGFSTERVRVRRNIAGFLDRRKASSEILISNL
jgi:DNA adenine methylase